MLILTVHDDEAYFFQALVAGAAELFLSVHTVERYRSSIMRKAGLQNRGELVALTVRPSFLSGAEKK